MSDLARSIATWKLCDPKAMSVMSTAAIHYALLDAKHDILKMAEDFDRVTSERDAALGREAAITRRESLIKEKLADCESALADAQQRLTAADERAVVLEGRVSMLLRELQELINDDDGILVAAELCTGFVWHALQKHGKAIEAALKPAEPSRDEHLCTGCGSKGWTANCKECVPY